MDPIVNADKPKRVLTDEQKAKMKAGRDAAKARRDAEKPNAVQEKAVKTVKPKRVLSDEQKAKMKAGRDAAKARKAAAGGQ